MIEQWRNINGFPGYTISNLGRVMSFKLSKTGRLLKQQLKKDHLSKTGLPEYLRVSLVDVYGESKNKRVHQLVLLAFDGPPPSEKHVGAHLDGNTRNNWISNLKWATQFENEKHKEIHGKKLLGSKCNGSKLTEADVRKIRKAKVWDSSVISSFAATLGVSRNTIHRARKGQTWGWL